ncbi:NAD(P)-binding protein [Phaeosphaeriaceae sp. SRC1lsM3a]|nr:NAD(P)-binding protein [Stagonospora sp. SRC1lsM3a]
MPKFNPSTLPSLASKPYIVTGATSGIGYYTALHLAAHSAHVYICARSEQKGSATRDTILALHPHAQISVLVMDHTRLSTVVAAAKEFISKEKELFGLVNNAGIMATPFGVTPDGYEEQFQTNHLAHWVFTFHLLPILQSTAAKYAAQQGAVRIVNLSSAGHYSAPKGGINFDDTSCKDGSPMTRYGQSKLANVLHAKMLHRTYGPPPSSPTISTSPSTTSPAGEIWVSVVHPGLVRSGLGDKAEAEGTFKLMAKVLGWVGQVVDSDEGSWTSLHCVAGPGMKREECGRYWQRMADPNGWQSAMAKDEKLAERLEEWTRAEMKQGGWLN